MGVGRSGDLKYSYEKKNSLSQVNIIFLDKNSPKRVFVQSISTINFSLLIDVKEEGNFARIGNKACKIFTDIMKLTFDTLNFGQTEVKKLTNHFPKKYATPIVS